MRRLVPKVNCDSCDAELEPDERSVVASVNLPAEGIEQRYSGELCEKCRCEFVARVADACDGFLSAEGPVKFKPGNGKIASRSPDAPAADRTCTVCGHVSRTRSALGAHLRQRHGTSFRQLGQAKQTRAA